MSVCEYCIWLQHGTCTREHPKTHHRLLDPTRRVMFGFILEKLQSKSEKDISDDKWRCIYLHISFKMILVWNAVQNVLYNVLIRNDTHFFSSDIVILRCAWYVAIKYLIEFLSSVCKVSCYSDWICCTVVTDSPNAFKKSIPKIHVNMMT